jgi:hypothetical protein
MDKMSCDHPYITLLLMDEKLCNPHLNGWKLIISYVLSTWWCMHRKQRVRQYGGLVNLEWVDDESKAREPLDNGRLCMTCKCWCKASSVVTSNSLLFQGITKSHLQDFLIF